jgi:DNA polymerase alpha subunit A
MADLLGEVDVNITRNPPAKRMKPGKETRPRVAVVSGPKRKTGPVETPVKVEEDYGSENMPMGDDDYTMMDDVIMSDPLPSSPVRKAVERKAQAEVKAEAVEEDDLMEVTQAVASASNGVKSVNISASRPVPKILKKPMLPTPVNSSPMRPENVDSTSWTSVMSKLNVQSSPMDQQQSVSSGKLKSDHALEEDGTLRMYWMDFTEIRGSLCLFGKVKDKSSGSYVSCFVKVDNIERSLYFLPREARKRNGIVTDEEINPSDVYNEVDDLMTRMKIKDFKIKPVQRKYAFEMPNIPKEGEYLKVLYPYDKPALSSDLSGETFSHVFGTNTALFEQFVLLKNIMGPCWLDIKAGNYSAVTNASWCKLELLVNHPDQITVSSEADAMEPPPVTLMSIAIRTTYNAKENKQELLIASGRVYENVPMHNTTSAEKLPSKSFTVMRPISEMYPAGFKLELQKHRGLIAMERNETALLSKFMALVGNADPDVIIGHRLDDVDASVLINRLKEKKTPGWHRLGRLRRSEWPKSFSKGGSFFADRQILSGRLFCDLANEYGKSLMLKCQSWSLSEMCDLILRETRREIDNEQALKTWANSSAEGLMQYVTHCEADTHFIAAIALRVQMIPLSKQLTNLAGNSWARTLSGTRAERNEYILLHEFHRNKYICPDKTYGKAKAKSEDDENDEGADAKKKDKYKGGLVFEPEKGLYDKIILVMDFNSLYPSIIQEFNICFTTVERSDIASIMINNGVC